MPLSLEHQVGQMFMVGFAGYTAPSYLLDWIAAGRVGGVILFARNVESPQQLADLTRTLHEASALPLLIAIDQEGGRVARLWHSQGFSESPGAMALAAAEDHQHLSREISHLMAVEMRAMGINWNYAPAVDITYNANNPTVGTRSYGSDPRHVSIMAAAAVMGFQTGGVAACAKHFPGLGDTAVDSHLDLPVVESPVDHIIAQDLDPYRAVCIVDVASIMTTHTLFPDLDPDLPATLSPHVLKRLLRDELGYDGVITTDCMEMQAISDHYASSESAILAAQAGVDVILISHTPERQSAAYEGLLQAVKAGRVSETQVAAANRRIAALKAKYGIEMAAIDPAQVGTDANRARMVEAARAGIVQIRAGEQFPLARETVNVGVIEFNALAESLASDPIQGSPFTQIIHDHLPETRAVTVNSMTPQPSQVRAAKTLADMVDVLIIATRNAHMVDAQRHLAQELLDYDKQTILVALVNPYDVEVLSADTVLCSCGDSIPSLEATAAAIVGAFTPNGTVPVALEPM